MISVCSINGIAIIAVPGLPGTHVLPTIDFGDKLSYLFKK